MRKLNRQGSASAQEIMNRKLLLVSPKKYALTYDGYTDHMRSIIKQSGELLIASLATIAALTPAEFEVKIIDENVELIDFSEPYHLVGITSFPSQLYRAEEIAKEFSKRGVLVVCGGSSVSLSPERWRSFSDVLIIGEAERIWPQFIAEYLAGSYKREYREKDRFDLSVSPLPDYRGYSPGSLKNYSAGIVQASRGCPHQCEFCDAVVYTGRKIRYKPVDNILDEISQLYKMGLGRHILLSDDNFAADKKKARSILAALRDWMQRQRRPGTFHTQLSIDIAGDDYFLELAAEAGLLRLFIGIETPRKESLKEAGKNPNINTDLLAAVRKIHQFGIQVTSGCIVGFDHDDLSIFREQLMFFMQAGIPIVRVGPLEVLDGTPLKQRMVREGRYIDWEKEGRKSPETANEFNTLTLKPKQMTGEQLRQGIFWLLWQLYKPESFAERFRLFLAHFKESDRRKKLKIPKMYLDPAGVVIVLRLLIYILTRSNAAERSVFRRMFRPALQSSHPRRFALLVENFLEFMNTREKLTTLCREEEAGCYPAEGKGIPTYT